jgi:hypothetical protein
VKFHISSQQNNFMISREAAREIDAQVERIAPEIDALLDGLKGAEINSRFKPNKWRNTK